MKEKQEKSILHALPDSTVNEDGDAWSPFDAFVHVFCQECVNNDLGMLDKPCIGCVPSEFQREAKK